MACGPLNQVIAENYVETDNRRGNSDSRLGRNVSIIHCFGAGLVGSYVARTLADRGHEVHVHDLDPYNGKIVGHPNITIHEGDALETDLSDFGQVDLVVNMLPGDIGHALTTDLAEERYPTVDLSFSEHTPDRYDEKARDWGGRILWDVGIAPGLSNICLLYTSPRPRD